MTQYIRVTTTGTGAAGLVSIQGVPQTIPTITSLTPAHPVKEMDFTITGLRFTDFGRIPVSINIDSVDVPFTTFTDTTISATTPTFGSYPHVGTITVVFSDGITATHSITVDENTPTFSQIVVSLNPLGFWMLDETSGTTAVDQSGNGRNGTYTNPAHYTQAQASLFGNGNFKSAHFEGPSDDSVGPDSGYVSIPDDAALRLGASGTVFAFIKMDVANTGPGTIFGKEKCCGYSDGWRFEAFSGEPEVRFISGGGVNESRTAGSLVGASAHMIGFRWDGVNARFFMDGALIGAAITNFNPGAFNTGAANGNLFIGNRTDTLNDGAANADLQAAVIFDYALSDSDIANLWTATT